MTAHLPLPSTARLQGGSRRLRVRWHPLAWAVACAVAPAWAQKVVDVRLPEMLSGTGAVKGVGSYAIDAAKATGTVTQVSKRAIYHWKSFDIGRDAVMNFDMKAGTGSSALNRVLGSARPSEILGKLNANGNVFLINPNGVLFASTAQVNVQGLIASTLDLTDDVFLNDLNTINTPTATFTWQDVKDGDGAVISTYDHPNNFVRVASGADIRTATGGQVFLMARTVENAGRIEAHEGQAVLVSGDKVWLKSPDQEKIYASESNDNIPATRGLLVEVSGTGGSVHNLGEMLADKGNLTLVGYAVRQSGRLKSSTSNAANGAVFLQARTDAVQDDDSRGPGSAVRASRGGTLTLDAGSRIEITADGEELTDSNATFTRSRIELAGQTISLGTGSAIVAPGAMVKARAEDTPDYKTDQDALKNLALYATTPSSTARITIDQGAIIDVSGTRNTEVSVARNFLTTELLGYSDLKDAPVQKDGALYRSKVTFDVRDSAAVIGHDRRDANSSYTKGIKKTAQERLAEGGSVSLASTGAVITRGGSAIDVSGGQITYKADTVKPSQLLGADGKLYTVNSAQAGVKITKVLSEGDSDATRFGMVTEAVANLQGRPEAGYVEGKSAGTLKIFAPTVVAEGQIRASTIQGVRQRLGRDARAATGKIELSSAAQLGSVFSRGLTVAGAASSLLGEDFWKDPATGVIMGGNRITASALNGSGAGSIKLSVLGQVVQEDGADLSLADGSALTLSAATHTLGVITYDTADGTSKTETIYSGGVELGGNIVGTGATVDVSTQIASLSEPADIVLGAGRIIDVSGQLVNRQRDGVGQAAALAGGNVTLRSAGGLDVQDGSRIDVSGGATVSATGAIVGTRAGAISLISDSQTGAPIHLGAELRGQQMASTATAVNDGSRQAQDSGKLTIKAGDVRIVAPGEGASIQTGEVADGLILSSDVFSQGGFSHFDIAGARRLDVAGDVLIEPRVSQWVPGTAMSWAASGVPMGAVAQTVVTPEGQRPIMTLNLSSEGILNGSTTDGALHLAEGSRIVLSPRSTVTLKGGTSLEIDGQIQAAGGQVTMDLTGVTDGSATSSQVGTYRVGDRAIIDVSGTTVLSPNASGQRLGQVLDGGSIKVKLSGAQGSTVTLAQGAQLKANGASGVLDVSEPLQTGGVTVRRQTVASNGGSISIQTSAGGGVLAGDMQAHAGGESAAGGALAIMAASTGTTRTDDATATIRLQHDRVNAAGPVDPGVVTVSAQAVQAGGFDDLTLSTSNRSSHIELKGPVSLSMRRDLALDAPLLLARDATRSVLRAGSRLSWTNSTGLATPAAGDVAGANVTLQGGLLDLAGQMVTEGISQLTLVGDTEVRMRKRLQTPSVGGGLRTQADVTITAPQITAGTAVNFTVDASGHALLIDGGDATAAAPLSAGGSLTFKAATIDQHGAIQAPFGQISLLASERVTMHEGSLTSVSGDGLTVPYGVLADGQTQWQVNGARVEALPQKTITVQAPGQSVQLQAGSTLDLSAGGDLVAWEFVSGPGGSKDVFTGSYDTPDNRAFAVVPGVQGYAPVDADLLVASGAGDPSALQTARQITLGEGAGLPAGTYTILPARYALLPGAYLLRPSTQASLGEGQSQALLDGSVLVGARIHTLGTTISEAQPRTFQVMSRDLAKQYSDVREAKADSYFSAVAASRDQTAPLGTAQGGILNLAANRLALEGRTLFKNGGELNIAAERIRVSGDPASEAPDSGALTLSDATLNATGAASIMLGGLREGRDEQGVRTAQVQSSSVVLGTGARLRGSDVILAARDEVRVADGAHIETSGSAQASDLSLSGDGALVRVSADDTVQTTRRSSDADPITRQRGALQVGDEAVLEGGALTVEATQRTTIAGSAALKAQALTVGAGRVAVGDGAAQVAAERGDVSTLVLTPELANQLGQAKDLTLRSYDGVDMVGRATLGDPSQASLTLDTQAIRVLSGTDASSGMARITAGSVTLTNTTGLSSEAQPVAVAGSQLTVQALGQAGADGHVRLGTGTVALSGAEVNRVQAAGSIVVDSTRSVTVVDQGTELQPQRVTVSTPVPSVLDSSGDLTLQAQSLTTVTGRKGEIRAAGRLRVEPSSATAVAPAEPGVGGILALKAQTIEQAGTIAMPSGALTLEARGQQGSDAISFQAGSRTLLAGISKVFDGLTVATSGGDLNATAQAGHVRVGQGAEIDVSAGMGDRSAQAGSVTLAAPGGAVIIEDGAQLKALSRDGQGGGRLRIDSRDGLPDLGLLSRTLEAHASQKVGNFARELNLRQRVGDLTLDTQLRAERIQVVNDGGHLRVQGQLDAQGAQGGEIILATQGDLVLARGSVLDVQATQAGASGGRVTLASSEGSLRLQAASTLNLSGGEGAQGGTLDLRAMRTEDNLDVKVDPIQAAIHGARSITVEGVKVYEDRAAIDAGFVRQAVAEAEAFTGTDGAQAQAIAARLAGADAAWAQRLAVRAGVEARSPGDMTVTGDMPTGWNLTRFDATGVKSDASGAQPMNLTLRAGGDLHVTRSLSSGFAGTTGPNRALATTQAGAAANTPAGVIQAGEGADLTLIGGADLSSADVMAVGESTQGGSVILGQASGDVLVRSTTGDIDIAAARDVRWLNDRAVVYTTGRVASDAQVGSRFGALDARTVAQRAALYVSSSTPVQNLFLTDAGRVQVQAGHDVFSSSTAAPQFGTEWRFTNGDLSKAQFTWWNRYDKFQQGLASFGGGDVRVQAGGSVRDLGVTSASSGYFIQGDATPIVFEGGRVAIEAQEDIAGVYAHAGGDRLDMRAGQDMRPSEQRLAPHVQYQDTAVRIDARQSLTLGSVTEVGAVSRAATPLVLGLAPQASAVITAAGGDVTLSSLKPNSQRLSDTRTLNVLDLFPMSTRVSAPLGSLSVGSLYQRSALGADLSLLADGDLSVATLGVRALDALAPGPTVASPNDLSRLVQVFGSSSNGLPYTLEVGSRDPVRLVSALGAVSITDQAEISNPVRILADQDVSVRKLRVQHQGEQELSLVRAGRDVHIGPGGDSFDDLKVDGPGDLIVSAGRHVLLNGSAAGVGGIGAMGNRENPLLDDGSARVTVMAGVDLAHGADYARAANAYYHLLGGTGVAAFAGDLWASLQAVGQGQMPPALGSEAASRFDALTADQKLAQVRQTLGEARYQQVVLDHVRHVRADPDVTLSEALRAVPELTTQDKTWVVAQVLASAWSDTLSPAQKMAQALAMAEKSASPVRQALVDFVQTRSQRAAPPTVAEAVEGFAALAREQQALFINQVLSKDVRDAGRAAASLTGAERELAYVAGERAIETVFPGSKGVADLKMPLSQIKTLQDSPITVMAPHGGAEVGPLSASAEVAVKLGIVTTSGGGISGLVRDNVAVNQSRIFTVAQGDVLLWSSRGNIDAGRGAKTVTGSPPPVLVVKDGKLVVDTSGSYSGSGIAVLDPNSALDLYAPRGEINAGDAGISSAGQLTLGATRIVGADNIAAGGPSVGVPAAPVVGNAATQVGSLGQAATSAGAQADDGDARKKKARRSVLLELLGFGDESRDKAKACREGVTGNSDCSGLDADAKDRP